MNRTLLIILLIVLAGGLLWYFNSTQDTTALANPASAYCVEQGGRHEVRTDGSGEYGVCVFNDGRECEEWAFYQDNACAGPAGMPNPASVYCAENSGTVDIRTDSQGGQFGVCVFADGSECEEWAFFRHGACNAP
ncbi:MAG: DUF333 domain-containing protein [Anaerolineales bacterium]|nr:DUF333 domain-containing protein [Anaerolineales bacterium]